MSGFRICSRCKNTFDNINDFGKWQCFQHPGKIIFDIELNDYVFSCCKTRTGGIATVVEFYKYNPSKQATGCIRADHRTNLQCFSSTNEGRGYVNQATIQLLKIPNSSTEESPDPKRRLVQDRMVYKFDWKKQDETLNKMID